MQSTSIKIPLAKSLLIIMVSIISETAYSQTKVKVYDLEAYVNTVRKNNLQLKITENKSNMASLSIKDAISALLPQVNVRAQATRFFDSQYTYFETPDFENTDPATGEVPTVMQQFKVGFNNEFQAHLLLEQNLFSLQKIYDLKSARQYSNTEELQNNNQIIKIIAEAKKAFLQTILIQKVVEVNEVSEKYAQDNYLAEKSKFENDLISELDLLQAKSRWEEEVPKLSRARRNHLILLGNLKVIAGINPVDSIALNYDLSFYDYKKPVDKATDVISDRFDYRLLETNEQLQELNIKNKKAEYLPALNLNIGYSFISTSDNLTFAENQNKFPYATVSLAVPVFSSGYRKNQVNKAKILRDNASLEKQEAELSMAIEIQNLKMKLEEEHETVQVAIAVRKTAKKAYDIAVETAKSGLISQLDLHRIGTDHKRAEINLHNNIYNLRCTQIDYNIAIANY